MNKYSLVFCGAALLCLGSCSISSNGRDYNKKYRLAEPWSQIRNDIFEQVVRDQTISVSVCENSSSRQRTVDSVFLHRLYGEIDGAYILDYIINGEGDMETTNVANWNTEQGVYHVMADGCDYSLDTQNRNEVIVWKRGTVYSLSSACEAGIITGAWLESHSVPAAEQHRSLFLTPTTIEDQYKEHMYYLPDYLNGSYGGVDLSAKDSKMQEDETYSLIKKAYYQQRFVEKGIHDDSAYSSPYYIPRKITESSLLLTSFYGAFDGAYLFTMTVNGHGEYGKTTFRYGEKDTYFQGSHLPEVYKGGTIYDLKDALDKGLIDFDPIAQKHAGTAIEHWNLDYYLSYAV